jgi:signal transduction histidine kinase
VNTLSRVIGTPGPIGFRIEDVVDAEPETAPQSSVLIVDDDPAERLALRSILEPLGHPIVEATSGAEARRCVSDQDFAVILLDVRASSIDGFETAAFIRSREASRLTPVIFLTTIDRAEKEMTIGYAMGAVDFVVAPLVPAALRGKVSLFADLFAKTQELVERARRLRIAATRASEALGMQRDMLDRMEELGRTKSDFVSKISHELRSPLTSVIGYVELLLDGGAGVPNAEQARMLTIMERNSLRLLALIEDLLTMSRVEAGIFELDTGPVDLAAVIEYVRETTAPAVAKAELELVVELGTDLQLIGDRVQLERALLNLVANSVKFTLPGGQVAITTQIYGDEIAVSVRDTGSGIPSEEQEHLFSRFFRATRSQEQEVPGTGLGLYIVKQIVELHGGTMDVFSTNQGSTFTMLLPVAGPPVV